MEAPVGKRELCTIWEVVRNEALKYGYNKKVSTISHEFLDCAWRKLMSRHQFLEF